MQGIAQYTLPCKVWALPRVALPAGQTPPLIFLTKNSALVIENFGCFFMPK